ncbi:ABC transporter ATP-binding protein [Actinospica robiniae]|uniref:ABC-type antimicrobial peptide transport system, ATPase component n=1 Tax=Actinospica robiniae DSM 44927 TaxID=479430 RepID=W9E4J6_9ACTN|nr:ABC transporter ATP-binding protein [Actinospica robiniae]ETA71112.1 ABC-type antimicrobial peptide transport system, ATPase component [Actinospica robiniae DSM 44927]
MTELADPSEVMVSARNLRRTFGSGDRAVHAVNDVSFDIPRGQLCAVVGRSGAGKTSLLNLLGGLDRPDSGSLSIDGKQVFGDGLRPSRRELTALRRDTVGFVFQNFSLLPILNAAENVGVPLRVRRTPAAEREDRVSLLLKLVGLGDHRAQRPGELSGGQQQRVAIARSLVHTPRLLIADEPTGQLDSQTGRDVMELLHAVVLSENVTAIVATHDEAMIELADRVLTISDGALTGS